MSIPPLFKSNRVRFFAYIHLVYPISNSATATVTIRPHKISVRPDSLFITIFAFMPSSGIISIRNEKTFHIKSTLRQTRKIVKPEGKSYKCLVLHRAHAVDK